VDCGSGPREFTDSGIGKKGASSSKIFKVQSCEGSWPMVIVCGHMKGRGLEKIDSSHWC
jgi:hypothetical protein